MWLLLAGCALPDLGGPPPDLTEEMRAAAPDDPRLVQCLLRRLEPLDEKATWRAAWSAATARGHTFESVQAYRDALDGALARWVVSPPEEPGSRAEQNRWLCTAGRGIRAAEVADRLAGIGDADRADLRLLLLAATEEVPWPEATWSRFVRVYKPCWADLRESGRKRSDDRAVAPSIGVRHARSYATPPGWTAARDVIAILADPAGFFAAGRPAWDGLEGFYVVDMPDATVVLAGGGARCHVDTSELSTSDAGLDLFAWRIDGAAGHIQRIATTSARGGLTDAAITGVRADGDTLRVDTAAGSTPYWLAESGGGCLPDRGPRWYLTASAPRPDEPMRRGRR